MISLAELRGKPLPVLVIGTHHAIVQSMLDYQFACGFNDPQVVGTISTGRKQERYFWGETEIELPVFTSVERIPSTVRNSIAAVVSVQSGRSMLRGMVAALDYLPNVRMASIFAEGVPESHALELARIARKLDILVLGPASVGMFVPGVLKLGAIAGVHHLQLTKDRLVTAGDTAVVSTSGGMVNELMYTVLQSGLGISVAMALGGDRFPITTPLEACLLAQDDPQTKRLVYFGELGGEDEYHIAQAVRERRITKPIFAYIAGEVAELFEEPPQFGHAKALAKAKSETAAAKKHALVSTGVTVVDSFADLAHLLQLQSGEYDLHKVPGRQARKIGSRKHSLLTSHISGDSNGQTQLLGQELLTTVNQQSFAGLAISMLLGHHVRSLKVITFTDYVFRLLADHGPYVSGAANTIITARAGKDLVSSLVAGLLTIGPRFGGAINEAAAAWLQGVSSKKSAKDFVRTYTQNGGIIPGIGHKKYRVDLPDPRVKALRERAQTAKHPYLSFALAVQEVTTAKKNNLILNVDGTIAACLLDLLSEELQYSPEQLQELVDIEFFNSLFVLSRSIGLASHYLDQRRHDEGLLRLDDEHLRYFA